MYYKIEKNIPAPSKHTTELSPERQALDKLQPGESVLFPADRADRARTAAVNKHAKDGWNYVTKRQPDGSRRIWRLT